MISVSERLLIDTDVLVDYLRGRPEAAAFLEGAEGRLLVSAISIAELYAGIRDRTEEDAVETFLGAFEVVAIDSIVARAGGRYRAESGPSHGTGLADALVAASRELASARLVTRNRKHFPMVEDVVIPY